MVKKKRPNLNAQVHPGIISLGISSPDASTALKQDVVLTTNAAEVLATFPTIDESIANVVSSANDSCNQQNAIIASISSFVGDVVAASELPTPPVEEKREGVPIFKDPSFVHSNKSGQAAYKRTRVWKNLKQIIAAERMLSWGPNDVTYAMIDAPLSFKPAKKYSDITGLPAKYTDPQTKIRFATSEEFTRIRTLPADLITGYLTLRKANAPVP